MDYPAKNEIPYEEIANGALILQLLRENQTWENLCHPVFPKPSAIESVERSPKILTVLQFRAMLWGSRASNGRGVSNHGE